MIISVLMAAIARYAIAIMLMMTFIVVVRFCKYRLM